MQQVRSSGRALAIGLAVAFTLIYGLSASHTVILDDLDAAEFQTVGAAGGIPHQPYPLWRAPPLSSPSSSPPFG